jgi:hypothetical protein
VSSEAEFRAVLEKHPLIVGEGHYEGEIICAGCHWVLGNPASHLTQVLAAALDPNYCPSEATVAHRESERRESYIRWEEPA